MVGSLVGGLRIAGTPRMSVSHRKFVTLRIVPCQPMSADSYGMERRFSSPSYSKR